MASVLQYINTGTTGSAAATGITMPIQWCRPQHKPTCCIMIAGSGGCCMGVPTSATCYVIEIWSQGGGGAGGCCCGLGSYGGQGGGYSYVTCTTSGQAHCLCGCVCACGSGFCGCSICSICSGNTGQFAYVCDCTLSIKWCISGGQPGYWCCNPSSTWCWRNGSNNQTGTNLSNTYQVCRFCQSVATATSTATVTSSGTFLQLCGSDAGVAPSIQANLWQGCASSSAPATPGGGSSSNWVDWNSTFPKTTCSCFTPGFIWTGACGWSDPSYTSTPSACLNNVPSGVPNSYFCGFGSGVGGAAYAGGDQAYLMCNLSCGNNGSTCGNQNGNWPGGGGMSSHSRTSWSQPGSGAPGLILMSYC